MKQCPVCRTTYTDDTLQFCLSDGAKLNFENSDAKTIEMNADTHRLHFDLQNKSDETIATALKTEQPSKKGCSPLLIAGLLAALFLAFIGVAGAIYLFVPFGSKPDSAVVSANTTPNSQTPTPPNNTAVTDDINGKLANLEKQLAEQKKQNQTPAKLPFGNQKPTSLPVAPSSAPTAGVAPTGDGFLSLRTEPSVKTGVQLIKIPTGATVNLLGKCQNPGQTADGKKGRWCLISYNNQTGWVFDAYLNY